MRDRSLLADWIAKDVQGLEEVPEDKDMARADQSRTC